MNDSIWSKIDEEIAYSKALPPGTAPCAREEWNTAKGKKMYLKPNVYCLWPCDRCGWNPVVKKRRLIKMGYLKED